MKRGEMVLVACSLEAGAFSGERIFTLDLADTQSSYSGVVPAHYCFDENQQSLNQNQPAKDKPINGFVEAFLVANGGDQATVEFPDGEALRISLSQIRFRQDQPQGTKYVPVGPRS